jgi:hypothetical protein
VLQHFGWFGLIRWGKEDMASSSKIREIIAQLDRFAESFRFPMLDNLNLDLAGVRLSAYFGAGAWCLAVEMLAFFAEVPPLDGFSDNTYIYGDIAIPDAVNHTLSALHPVDNGPSGLLFGTGSCLYINKNIVDVRIRERIVPAIANVDLYRAEGIPVDLAPEITGDDFLRWLAPRYRDLLFATDEELYSRMTVRLPLILRLDEWHHPDLARGEKPSDTECFQQIAEVLATGDPSRYRPTEPPNTHWSNWLNK